MLNLPFNTSVVFGAKEKPLRFAILRPGFVLTLDKWWLVEIRKGYNLQLANRFRIFK